MEALQMWHQIKILHAEDAVQSSKLKYTKKR